MRRVFYIFFVFLSPLLYGQDIGESPGLYVFYHAVLAFLIVCSVFSFIFFKMRQLKQKLIEEEASIRNVMENTPLATVIINENNDFELINNSFLKSVGYENKEISNIKEFAEKVFPDKNYKDRVFHIFTERGENSLKENFYKDIKICCNSGEIRVFNLYIADINNKRIITFLDVTEENRTIKEREDLVRLLSNRTEELKSILYVASHDMRSPLVNIQGFSYELELGVKNSLKLIEKIDNNEKLKEEINEIFKEDVLEALEFINSGTKKIAELIDGLLKISRVGKQPIALQTIKMNKLLDDVIKCMIFDARQNDVEIILGDLPDCRGDLNQINQVFSNLVNNAIKYSYPDRKGEVHISGYEKGDNAVYVIKDNGIGIDPKNWGAIFEIFNRLNPEDSIEGEGLGLSLVRRIVSRHGGEVWVKSEAGYGAEFFVSLPLPGSSDERYS